MKKIFFIIILIILLSSVSMASNPKDVKPTQSSPVFNPEEDNWYKLEDWEKAVCGVWGGPIKPEQGIMSAGNMFTDFILTVQAKKTSIYIQNVTSQTLYEVYWVVVPNNNKKDAKMQFAMAMIGGLAPKIFQSQATATKTMKGSHVEYSTEDYQYVQVNFDMGSGYEVLRVPFVEVRGNQPTRYTPAPKKAGGTGDIAQF